MTGWPAGAPAAGGPPQPSGWGPAVFTVAELTAHLAALLESDPLLGDVWVRGEISNYKLHTSGHRYLTLKDEASQLDAVLFAREGQRLTFEPRDGMQVLAHGRIRIYPPRGRYQLYVDHLSHQGLGLLQAEFQRLFQRLQAEGLFEERRKRPLPFLPHWVGVITSPTGAAIRDILTVLRRRWPAQNVLFCPAQVQGEAAPTALVRALEQMNARPEVEVIIIGRGGGSIEDLWAFNDEQVARAIFASCIPVVSAVGHERDVTIADWVADCRAPTPSAAAEMVVPDRREMAARLHAYAQRLTAAGRQHLDRSRSRLDQLGRQRAWRLPRERIQNQTQQLDEWSDRLQAALPRLVREKRQALQSLERQLAALSPYRVLERGYALVLDRHGHLVDRTDKTQAGDVLAVRLADGTLETVVEAVRPASGGEEASRERT